MKLSFRELVLWPMRLVCLAAMVLGVKQTPSTNKGGSDGTAADGNGQRIEAEVLVLLVAALTLVVLALAIAVPAGATKKGAGGAGSKVQACSVDRDHNPEWCVFG